jgi:hypothetical protein
VVGAVCARIDVLGGRWGRCLRDLLLAVAVLLGVLRGLGMADVPER